MPRNRPAAEADLPQVSALLSATWHATYDQWYGPAKVTAISAEWHAPAMLARSLHQAGSILLVAENGFEIIGMVRAAIVGQTHVDLSQLYILPPHQSHGTGTALFVALLDALRALRPHAHGGFMPIRLEVEPRNVGAIRFYERHGFQRIGEVMNCGGGLSGIKADLYERAGG